MSWGAFLYFATPFKIFPTEQASLLISWVFVVVDEIVLFCTTVPALKDFGL